MRSLVHAIETCFISFFLFCGSSICLKSVQTRSFSGLFFPKFCRKRCSEKQQRTKSRAKQMTGFYVKYNIGRACNFIKKWLQLRCFPVNNAKFLRTPFFTEYGKIRTRKKLHISTHFMLLPFLNFWKKFWEMSLSFFWLLCHSLKTFFRLMETTSNLIFF